MYVLLYYAGVGALFQVFVDAKLMCEKELKKREEKKKMLKNASFGLVAFSMGLWRSPRPLPRHFKV